MSPDQQKYFDQAVLVVNALWGIVWQTALLTVGWNLGTEITHLPAVNPVAVGGLLVFLDAMQFKIKQVWRYFR